MSEVDLEQAAARAVDAAIAAGASDAEAWAEEGVEREIRVYEGAVESLTDAASHGIGIRSFAGDRWGYAYGTDLSDAGLAALAEAAAGAAAVDGIADDLGIASGFCGKGGQRVPAGVGQPHVRIRALTVGGTAG